MGKLKSELTWSFSRGRLFKECRRAYFYYYYLSWGGWEARADKLSRQAYILKNVHNIDIWIGNIVHQLIKWILQAKIAAIAGQNSNSQIELPGIKKDISYLEARKKAKDMLLKTWEQSRSRLWEKNVKYNLNLFEHYYHREPDRQELSRKLEKVTTSIKGFYDSGFLEDISKLSQDSFLSIDSLDSFDFEGTKVFAAPDFAVKANSYLLYDWKTGKENPKDTLQLSCYILYAAAKWKIPADNVKIIPVYLGRKDFSLTPVEPVDLAKVKEYIGESISQMRAILVSPQENKVSIESCPKTDQDWRCKTCRFQEICK